MTHKEYNREIDKRQREWEEFKRREWPTMVGDLAKRHFEENFEKGGFVNNGLRKWEPAKRITSGRTDADAKRGTLRSSHDHLAGAIQYVVYDYRVVVSNPVPYAPTHQFGETIHPTITQKMRRFAWAKHREAGPDTEEGKMWKGLALTKKTRLSIKMPARPFIGRSAELTRKINDATSIELAKILKI